MADGASNSQLMEPVPYWSEGKAACVLKGKNGKNLKCHHMLKKTSM